MKNKLKPCPFCGGKSKIEGNTHYVWVECYDCKSQTNSFKTLSDCDASNKAISAWNTRVEYDKSELLKPGLMPATQKG
jgi:Lar family restriction alleviation protein